MRTFTWKRLIGVLTSAVLATVGTVAVATPARAAWGSQIPFVLNAFVNSTPVGYTSGWIQFETNGTTFRYQVTVCRQSGYVTPTLSIYVNAPSYGSGHGTYLATATPTWTGTTSGSPCYSTYGTRSGQHSYSNLNNVRFLLVGGTFDHSYQLVMDEDYNRLINPY